jgi:hypothetical protein
MGIVMMSAPMLISTSTQSTYVALQQEGINEAASRVQMILGYEWDEENAKISDMYTPTILHTTSLTTDLLEVGTTTRRIGIPMESQRSYKLTDPAGSEFAASTTLGSDGGDSDDMDDYIADTTVNPIEAATIDYIEQQDKLNINTAITYGVDSVTGGYSQNIITYTPFGTATSTTSNVKNITVILTSTSGVTDLTKNIVLRAFSCNIGGYKLEEREF